MAATAAVAPAGGLTAEQAMANYRAMLAGPPDPRPVDCLDTAGNAIVVCAHRTRQPPRLPLPDERAEPGEVAHHPSEPPPAFAPGPPQAPSRQGETLKKLFGLLRSAATGEDSNPN